VSTERETAEEWERNRSVFDPIAVAVALALALVQLYKGLTVGSLEGSASFWSLATAVAFVAVAALYATDHWGPALYIVGAVLAGTLAVFWALTDPAIVLLEVVRLALAVALFLLFVYLFYRERAYYEMRGKRAEESR
jgi:Ca2+/Na+ antiporter